MSSKKLFLSERQNRIEFFIIVPFNGNNVTILNN